MYPTTYHKPASLDDAAALIAGGEGKFLAGGQTLLATMKQHLAMPSDLIDLRGLGLSGVRREGDAVAIGATTTHAEVAASPDAPPAIACLAEGIGDPMVRNMGTIGGSIANNDPAADYPAGALGMGATIVTQRRSIAADDFFAGLFATALEEDEIITEIRFPQVERAAYAKFDQPASRYALVGVFVAKTAAGARVAVTGAGQNGVFRHKGLEAALSADWSPEAVAGVEVSPDGLIADVHGSPAYRANLIRVMTRRAVAAS